MGYYLDRQLADYQISKNQIEILHHLYHQGGISQQQLGTELMLDKITVTKRLKGLVKAGYIEKRQSSEDGRIKKIYLTTRGEEIQSVLTDILTETAALLTAGITAEQEKLLRKLLARMTDNIYGVVSELRHE
jgi:DNA-binding MarR family transcriptional regulator